MKNSEKETYISRQFRHPVLQCKCCYFQQMAQSMAHAATDVMRRQYRDIPINIEAIKESPQAAIGNGSGIK